MQTSIFSYFRQVASCFHDIPQKFVCASNLSHACYTYVPASSICDCSNGIEQLFTQYRFPCRSPGQCFQAGWFLVSGTSPGQPARLIFKYQTTTFAATSKAKYMKHVLPILITQNSVFGSVFNRSLRICYNVFWYTFHRTEVHRTTWSPTKCKFKT